MIYRQRSKQQSIHYPERGGTCSDGQPDRQDRRYRRDFLFFELTPGKDGVATERIKPWDQPDIAAGFEAASAVAESSPRVARILPVGYGGGYVILELLTDLAAQSIPTKDID
jgi:hypothetical protein